MVLIAVIIPWVDALSVWRGPTSCVVRRSRPVRAHLDRLPASRRDRLRKHRPAGHPFFALFLAAAPLRLRVS
jgi:hypothetical protein